ncbi:hypothetical protein M432DRAFT_614725 [Thermoascus aurantiacus ATCC 26904]
MHACIMYSTCTQYGLAAVVGVVGGQDGSRQRERVIRSIIAACWLDGLLHCILCCVRYLHTYGHLGRYVRIWVPVCTVPTGCSPLPTKKNNNNKKKGRL